MDGIDLIFYENFEFYLNNTKEILEYLIQYKNEEMNLSLNKLREKLYAHKSLTNSIINLVELKIKKKCC